MDLEHTVGLRPDGSVWLPDRRAAAGSILLKLAALGVEIPAEVAGDEDVFHLAGNLFARYREQARSWPITSAPPIAGSSTTSMSCRVPPAESGSRPRP
jgi:hypothetical protein